jgi:hypothetical protein
VLGRSTTTLTRSTILIAKRRLSGTQQHGRAAGLTVAVEWAGLVAQARRYVARIGLNASQSCVPPSARIIQLFQERGTEEREEVGPVTSP